MVYLVGAGPGDPGLMTCRGAEVLRECEAVVYDRLGTSGLLELVPEDCEKIYVGKKPGSHSKKQEEINEILIDTAKRFDRVVRLKGGDPFVFGRGGEEVLALQKENIPFQLVPGCDLGGCCAGAARNPGYSPGDKPQFSCIYRPHKSR